MSKTEDVLTQLTQTVEQLEKLNEALLTLRHELLPAQPKKFAIMAAGPSEDMRRVLGEMQLLTAEITKGSAAA